jgi:hypothetical protein
MYKERLRLVMSRSLFLCVVVIGVLVGVLGLRYSSFAFAHLLGVAGVQEFRSSDDSAEGSLCVSLQGLEVLSELL